MVKKYLSKFNIIFFKNSFSKTIFFYTFALQFLLKIFK
jgi:hypothetical protein